MTKPALPVSTVFNQEASAPGFAGMLVDHEHFKHDMDKETTAAESCAFVETQLDNAIARLWSTRIVLGLDEGQAGGCGQAGL